MVAGKVGQPYYEAILDPKALRFVADRRAQTMRAAEQATKMASSIAADRFGVVGAEEGELFVALHASGYRAARRAYRKPIPDAERVEWARRWKLIRDFIAQQNLGLVYSTVSRFASGDIDREEQNGVALYTLLRAVEGFDPWRGFRFSTYACSAITRALIQLARKEAKYRIRFPAAHDVALERPTHTDGWLELYQDRLNHVLSENLAELTARETMVLDQRFPMDGAPRLTLSEIGLATGLSKERVRQIQDKALCKLREVLGADPVLQ